MARTKVIIYKPVLTEYLKSPKGQVGQYLEKRGKRVITAARAQVGKKTGHLAASIHMRQYPTALGQEMTIGSRLRHALPHHEGTKPHRIVARKAQVLRFTSGGRVIYTRSVMHPGTQIGRAHV